jgi:hypothetical protein
MTQAQAEAFMEEIIASAPGSKMTNPAALGRDRLDASAAGKEQDQSRAVVRRSRSSRKRPPKL